MGLEIERKFLVNDISFLVSEPHYSYVVLQYYINENIRVRLHTHFPDIEYNKAYVTMKYGGDKMVREEFEFEIDYNKGSVLYNNLLREKIGLGYVKKTRHFIIYNGLKWEVDIFHNKNEGLILAEIELKKEDEDIKMPGWIGREVTGEAEYYNHNLAQNPYISRSPASKE